MSFEVLTKTVEIDGETYEIRLLDAVTGYRVYVKMLNAVGSAFEGLKLKGASDGELAMQAVGAALANLSPELAEELRATFARSCCLVKDGKKPELKDIFLTHFRGRYGHLTKWLIACVKANFADFLSDESSETESPLKLFRDLFPSRSQKTSSGTSSGP
jgi:hypothetical protein